MNFKKAAQAFLKDIHFARKKTVMHTMSVHDWSKGYDRYQISSVLQLLLYMIANNILSGFLFPLDHQPLADFF